MLKQLITKRFTTIKGLAQVIADQRKGLEERDQEIKDLKAALAEERRRRVSLAERFLEYQRQSVSVPVINVRW